MTGETKDLVIPAARGSKSPSPSAKGSNPASPKSKSASPKQGSPEASAIAGILPAQHWVEAAEDQILDNSDAESIRSTTASSTASLTASILEYRKINGRTYHHEIGDASYWGANDEQQNESMDINHHVQTLALGGKFFVAPLDTEKVNKVLDIGTGTGSWAIDFADEYPSIEVIGTDISPIQSPWVPPNLKFEIEDCTLDWTFAQNSVDYIHARWLVGSIKDWEAVFTAAYHTLAPGGWLESHEACSTYESDDGTVTETSALGQWGKLFINFGESIDRSFTIAIDGVQRRAMEAAGFVDISETEYKTPVGTWPKDPAQREIGQYAQLAVESDIEGYILYPATALGWGPVEVSVFAAHIRKELRSPGTHSFYRQTIVCGRKPNRP